MLNFVSKLFKPEPQKIRIPIGPLKGEDSFIPFKISEIKQINHDTKVFKFEIPKPFKYLGLPIGQHITFKVNIKGEEIIRKYTPTSKYNQQGNFEVLIKIYEPTDNFPEGGKMTMYLNKLKEGDTILVSGPRGKFKYHGLGQVEIEGKQKKVKSLGFIAGGTGITPIYQVLQAIADDPDDKTETSLIYANKTISDILLKEELEQLYNKSNLQAFYTIDQLFAQNAILHTDVTISHTLTQEEIKAIEQYSKLKSYLTVDKIMSEQAQNWKGGVGYVNKEMIRKYMPKPSPETMVLYCGRKEMNQMVFQMLIELGYVQDQIFKF